ncbi:MAG TPA: hypothetical protein VH601_22245 [Bryobacteraceae bacterium]
MFTELTAGYQIVAPGRSPGLEAAVEARRNLVAIYEALNPQKAAYFRAEEISAENGLFTEGDL